MIPGTAREAFYSFTKYKNFQLCFLAIQPLDCFAPLARYAYHVKYQATVATPSENSFGSRNFLLMTFSGYIKYDIRNLPQTASLMTLGPVQKATFVSFNFCDIVLPNLETGRGGFHDVGA